MAEFGMAQGQADTVQGDTVPGDTVQADTVQGEFPVTAQTTATRLAERVGYDRASAYAVLDEAVMCHLGFVVDGRPVVLPQLFARVGDTLYLHGSTGARGLRMASGDGLPVCVTVTMLDGLVLARSAFHHSINYRSVVIHGIATVVTDEQDRLAAMTAMVEAIVPGRSAEVRGPSRKESAATTVLALPLESVSLKVRTGPPGDEDEDMELPYWAGVLPITSVPGSPQSAPDLTPGIPVPAHVTDWARP
jgi:nitroimidazol reductase NimA-like FMN-containing flavoprotein (pyridoxamine 5'-phosphate oxidase superfamily)